MEEKNNNEEDGKRSWKRILRAEEERAPDSALHVELTPAFAISVDSFYTCDEEGVSDFAECTPSRKNQEKNITTPADN